MWKFSRTKDERITLTPCLFMVGNALIYSAFYPHIIQVWGLVSFIFVRVFPQPSCNKREQASHFLFCIYPSPIVKKEFAENPIKRRQFTIKIISIMKKLSLFFVALTIAMVSCESEIEKSKVVEPTVVTKSIKEITESTAKVVGQVTADGGAEVTERGVCWNTDGIPTVLDY